MGLSLSLSLSPSLPPTLPRSPPSSSCRARANSNGGQRDARPILRRIPRPFMFARLSKPARLRKKKESPQKGVRSKTKGAGIEGVGIHFAWHAGKHERAGNSSEDGARISLPTIGISAGPARRGRGGTRECGRKGGE